MDCWFTNFVKYCGAQGFQAYSKICVLSPGFNASTFCLFFPGFSEQIKWIHDGLRTTADDREADGQYKLIAFFPCFLSLVLYSYTRDQPMGEQEMKIRGEHDSV